MMRVLRKGMKGEDVERWQTFLVGQGEAIEVDGDFGAGTHAATAAFQKESNLKPDGVVGSGTLGRAMMLGFDPLEDDDNAEEAGPNWPPRPATMKPLLSTAERQAIFGAFEFVHAPLANNKENIRILGGWEQQNIERIIIPQLVGVTGASHDGGVRFHQKVVVQLKTLWSEWESANLLDRVLTWEGSYVPRFMRGSTKFLSNHAFGSAFDINFAWNQLGKRPALVGEKGSVRELVTIANANGFFWGGHFAKRPDGMHFEIAEVK